jgi:glutamate racemase
MDSRAIGVFDSGVGGLTVLREIARSLPWEDLIYFGDTARVPYGSKSSIRIREYSAQNAAFLMSHHVKVIVVACNSASSAALEDLNKRLTVPVVGVIEPGAMEAIGVTRNRRIGVIGTKATVASHAYRYAIDSLVRSDDSYRIFEKACPLFVPIVEDNWIDHTVTRMVAEEYLRPMKENDIDSLILGCTHYPLLTATIQGVMGEGVHLVDSSIVVTRELHRTLERMQRFNNSERQGRVRCFVSDDAENFYKMATLFLDDVKIDVSDVSLDDIITLTL